MDNAGPDDTLPDLPDLPDFPDLLVSHPIVTSDTTREMITPSKRSETSLRSVVTVTETTSCMASSTLAVTEPDGKETAASQSGVTESTRITTGAVIEIVPMTNPALETETVKSIPDTNTGTQPLSMASGTNDKNIGETGKVQMNTQQQISEDYAIPEEIASEALLMLQEMSQPDPQESDDYDKYALPISTERLPDVVSEINEE